MDYSQDDIGETDIGDSDFSSSDADEPQMHPEKRSRIEKKEVIDDKSQKRIEKAEPENNSRVDHYLKSVDDLQKTEEMEDGEESDFSLPDEDVWNEFFQSQRRAEEGEAKINTKDLIDVKSTLAPCLLLSSALSQDGDDVAPMVIRNETITDILSPLFRTPSGKEHSYKAVILDYNGTIIQDAFMTWRCNKDAVSCIISEYREKLCLACGTAYYDEMSFLNSTLRENVMNYSNPFESFATWRRINPGSLNGYASASGLIDAIGSSLWMAKERSHFVQLMQDFRQYWCKVKMPNLAPEILEFMAYLEESKKPWYVVSLQPKNQILAELSMFMKKDLLEQIQSHVIDPSSSLVGDDIVSLEDKMKKIKTVELLLNEMKEKKNIDREDVLSVGDTKLDVEVAIQLNLRFMGVYWGYGARISLMEQGANVLPLQSTFLSLVWPNVEQRKYRGMYTKKDSKKEEKEYEEYEEKKM